MRSRPLLFAVAAGSLAAVASAAGPLLWIQSGHAQFVAGNPVSTSLTAGGEVHLAPSLDLLFETETPQTWASVSGSDQTVYVAAGTEGKVLRQRPGADVETFFNAGRGSVQALAWGPDEHLYIATAPRGGVYRVPPDYDGREMGVWYVPEQTYIWAMAFDQRERLYVATGDEGIIFRVGSDGDGEVFYDSNETHITALAIDGEDNLIAGSEGNGLVYRIDPDGDVFVLFDAPEPEIRGLVVTEAGIFVGTFGKQGSSSDSSSTTAEAPAIGAAARSSNGQGDAEAKGGMYRIHPDGFVETLWSSQKEGVHSVAAYGQGVIFGTGPEGRLLRADPTGEITLLCSVDSAQITAIVPISDDLLITTSNAGKVHRLGSQFRGRGEYISQLKDTGTVSRWGAMQWRSSTPEGTTVSLFSRSGNTATPDDTWSPWAGPYVVSAGSSISSPPARFLQWKAVMESDSPGLTPALQGVQVVYVQRNLPPAIAELSVHPGGVIYRPTGSFEDSLPFAQLPASVEEELSRLNETAGSPNSGNTTRPPRPFLGRPYFVAGLQTFSWQSTDPNGDVLEHNLSYRGEGETEWKPMVEELSESLYTFDTTRLPDGVYRVRLSSSDSPSNPEGGALADDDTSRPFVIDNSPPLLNALEITERQDRWILTGVAEDSVSLLRQIEYSVDGGRWRTVLPRDGVADSLREEILIEVEDLVDGEHTVVVRVTDNALNRGAGKAVLVVP